MRYVIEDTEEGFKLTVGGWGDPRREFVQKCGHGPIERLYVEVVKRPRDPDRAEGRR